MKAPQFVILGCGYTGTRVAKLLSGQGGRVLATTRDPRHLHLPGVQVVRMEATEPRTVGDLRHLIEPGARLLYSIPLLGGKGNWTRSVPLLASALEGAVERVVYLSTTSVYGPALDVDENSPAAPRNPRESLRVAEEADLAAGAWSCLILRPAAIYGPGRGVHVALREGRHGLWGDGANYVSRIHVDDLAAIAAAALASALTGVYPVADDQPCPSVEITRYCAALLGIPDPSPARNLSEQDTRRVNRRVDGTAIRRALGVILRYPDYRQGIAAALSEEAAS